MKDFKFNTGDIVVIKRRALTATVIRREYTGSGAPIYYLSYGAGLGGWFFEDELRRQ